MADKGRLATRIGWVVAAASGPGAVAIGAWLDLVSVHWVTAMAVLAYEAVLMALASVWGIVGDLWKRWRERIVDYFDLALQRRFSRFGRSYRQWVLDNQRFIDQSVLAIVGPFTPELDEVFVDVSLAPCALNDLQEGILADLPVKVTDRHSISDLLDRPKAALIAVVGVPGSGKSTLLQRTAKQVSRARRDQRRTVAILLYLRDHVGAIISTPDVSLSELQRGVIGRLRDEEPRGWFEQQLRNGDCVVLFDGLDEVAGLQDRRSVADWIERQIGQYPQNDYVITSRPQGYRSARIAGADVFQVCRFTDDQVTRFVRSWYLAVKRPRTGEISERDRSRAEGAAGDLLNRLNGAPELYDLTVNPLLLTMIANVHHYSGALPGSRVLLYREICQVMLWRRQEIRNIPTELDGDTKERLLRGLAFAMMKQQVRDLSRAEVLAKFRSDLRRIPQRATAEDYLADIRANGLLIERRSDFYSFAHETFQDYFAATHIRDKGLHHVLVNAVDDPWWQETTLLYTAQADADVIVQACLDSMSVTALSLAFACADQNSELAPELRDRLDELLTSNIDLERRRLMASLVTRHLRHPIRTDNGGRVCFRPIPIRLYRLYQQDTQAPALDGPPQSQDTNNPVTGVRGSDAVAFVKWVNDLTDTDYYLPNLAEVNDSAVQRALTPAPGAQAPSVWLQPKSGHGQPQLWTLPGTDHPHMVNATTLASHIKKDFERSIPTLTQFLLLRSIAAVRALADVLDCPLAVPREHAVDLARALDRVLTLDHPRDLDRALKLDLAHALTVDRARALDLAGSHGRDLDLDRALGLTSDRDHAFDLENALDLARALALDRDTALDRDLQRVTGSALSHTLTRTFSWRTPTTWLADFSQAFIKESGINETSYIVSPDILADKVHSGREALWTVVEAPDNGAPSHQWAYQVASDFEEIALPILTRQHPLASDAVTTIRITALCLAVEADIRDAQPVGDTFREIAAGATLLERRAHRLTLPTETIILATT